MSAENLTIGEVDAGRYRVLRRIAAGGMGAVYEVEHLGTASHRALKVMHAHMVQSEELPFMVRKNQHAREPGGGAYLCPNHSMLGLFKQQHGIRKTGFLRQQQQFPRWLAPIRPRGAKETGFVAGPARASCTTT